MMYAVIYNAGLIEICCKKPDSKHDGYLRSTECNSATELFYACKSIDSIERRSGQVIKGSEYNLKKAKNDFIK